MIRASIQTATWLAAGLRCSWWTPNLRTPPLGSPRAVPRAFAIRDPVLKQPLTRIRGIIFEPRPRAAKPEAITPRIHVGAQPLPADARQLTRQQPLQITHGGILRVVLG